MYSEAKYLLGANDQIVIVAVAIIVSLLILLAMFLMVFSFMRVWLTAFLGGHPVSFFRLVGMRFRRVDAKEVVKHGVAAAHAGHPIPWSELEWAYLQGVDLEKVALAYTVSQEQGKNFTFDELVKADSESKLDELVKGWKRYDR